MQLTVRDLMNELHKLPKDSIVVLSSDAEGNSFHQLDGIDPSARWDPAAKDLAMTSDGEWIQRAPKAIILFPEHR